MRRNMIDNISVGLAFVAYTLLVAGIVGSISQANAQTQAPPPTLEQQVNAADADAARGTAAWTNEYRDIVRNLAGQYQAVSAQLEGAKKQVADLTKERDELKKQVDGQAKDVKPSAQ